MDGLGAVLDAELAGKLTSENPLSTNFREPLKPKFRE
jgi:hypothetical protein